MAEDAPNGESPAPPRRKRKLVRYTVNLDDDLHRILFELAAEYEMDAASMLRGIIVELVHNPKMARKVLGKIQQAQLLAGLASAGLPKAS